MAQHHDPEPWVCTDEEGKPFRTRYAREDGVDELGEEWSGWAYSPRSDAELRAAGYDVPEPVAEDSTNFDPEPWVCMDEEGQPFRARYAHEDGVDEQGQLWEGWTFSPRTREELGKLGLL